MNERGGPAVGLAGLAPATIPPTQVVTPTPSAEADGSLLEVSAGIAVDSVFRGSALPGTNKNDKDNTASLLQARQASARLESDTNVALKFKGVRYSSKARLRFVAFGPADKYLGTFATAQEAALAYDVSARNAGRLAVNFPRPGTDEVQAIRGKPNVFALQ